MKFKFSVFCPAQKVAPFYEEWWFLVVVALVGLIFILLLVFILIIRGQSKKYAKKSESGECTQLHNEMGHLTVMEALYIASNPVAWRAKNLMTGYERVTLSKGI